MSTIKKFLACQSGASRVEYGIVAVGFALAVFATLHGLGSRPAPDLGSVASH